MKIFKVDSARGLSKVFTKILGFGKLSDEKRASMIEEAKNDYENGKLNQEAYEKIVSTLRLM